jgi:hypothetical protein
LEPLVRAAGEHRTLRSRDVVLDLGCGLGGPGRFLAERFGCSVIGIDHQMAPIPDAMSAVTQQAPYLAVTLPDLTRTVEDAGLHVAARHDTTDQVVTHFRAMRARLTAAPTVARAPSRSAATGHALTIVDGYLAALGGLGSRTGILVAARYEPSAS